MKTHKTPLRRMLGLILCLSMLVSPGRSPDDGDAEDPDGGE